MSASGHYTFIQRAFASSPSGTTGKDGPLYHFAALHGIMVRKRPLYVYPKGVRLVPFGDNRRNRQLYHFAALHDIMVRKRPLYVYSKGVRLVPFGDNRRNRQLYHFAALNGIIKCQNMVRCRWTIGKRWVSEQDGDRKCKAGRGPGLPDCRFGLFGPLGQGQRFGRKKPAGPGDGGAEGRASG